MKIIKNASGKFLIETDRKGLMVIRAALRHLDECAENCPLYWDHETSCADPICERWAKQMDEALDPDLQRDNGCPPYKLANYGGGQ